MSDFTRLNAVEPSPPLSSPELQVIEAAPSEISGDEEPVMPNIIGVTLNGRRRWHPTEPNPPRRYGSDSGSDVPSEEGAGVPVFIPPPPISDRTAKNVFEQSWGLRRVRSAETERTARTEQTQETEKPRPAPVDEVRDLPRHTSPKEVEREPGGGEREPGGGGGGGEGIGGDGGGGGGGDGGGGGGGGDGSVAGGVGVPSTPQLARTGTNTTSSQSELTTYMAFEDAKEVQTPMERGMHGAILA